jgi:NTE family protein
VFNALCSDLNRFSVAEAVHASMAVPLVFAPVILKTYPDSCNSPPAPWIDTVLANPEATSTVKAVARALRNYRNPTVMKYVKLVDGGVTDNFGLSSILIGRTASRTSYGPFTALDVVRMKRMVFLVVDAGRGPSGDWALDTPGPSGFDMALAATDTAIDAAARSSYDGFRLMMAQCDDLQRLEVDQSTWDCKNVKFFVGSVNFADLEVQRAAKLDAIPTRLSLPQQDIDAAIEAGKDATLSNAAFRSFLNERVPQK